jgi:hypothetical protein
MIFQSFLISFILFFTHKVLANYFTENMMLQLSDCNIFTKLAAGINFNYFEDQFSLTIIDPTEDSVANGFKVDENLSNRFT